MQFLPPNPGVICFQWNHEATSWEHRCQQGTEHPSSHSSIGIGIKHVYETRHPPEPGSFPNALQFRNRVFVWAELQELFPPPGRPSHGRVRPGTGEGVESAPNGTDL